MERGASSHAPVHYMSSRAKLTYLEQLVAGTERLLLVEVSIHQPFYMCTSESYRHLLIVKWVEHKFG